MTARTHTQAAGRDTVRTLVLGALAVLVLAGLLAAAYSLGAASTPNDADAQRAEVTARQDAYETARADAEQAAYEQAWETSYATSAEAARRAGTAAGTRAVRGAS